MEKMKDVPDDLKVYVLEQVEWDTHEVLGVFRELDSAKRDAEQRVMISGHDWQFYAADYIHPNDSWHLLRTDLYIVVQELKP